MQVRYKEDRSKMKAEYNDGDCALRLGKMKYDEARIKLRGLCPCFM